MQLIQFIFPSDEMATEFRNLAVKDETAHIRRLLILDGHILRSYSGSNKRSFQPEQNQFRNKNGTLPLICRALVFLKRTLFLRGNRPIHDKQFSKFLHSNTRIIESRIYFILDIIIKKFPSVIPFQIIRSDLGRDLCMTVKPSRYLRQIQAYACVLCITLEHRIHQVHLSKLTLRTDVFLHNRDYGIEINSAHCFPPKHKTDSTDNIPIKRAKTVNPCANATQGLFLLNGLQYPHGDSIAHCKQKWKTQSIENRLTEGR